MKVRIGTILSEDHLAIQIGGFRYEDKDDPRLSMPFELVPDLDWKSGPLNANLVGHLIMMLTESFPDLAYHQQQELERKAALN